MKKANRDLLLVGIKLIGLWLLFHAVIDLAQSAFTGGVLYHTNRRAALQAPWQPPEGISAELADELRETSRMEHSMRMFSNQVRMMQAWWEAPWHLVMALIGLYMCRSGSLVLRFLGVDNEENPNNRVEDSCR